LPHGKTFKETDMIGSGEITRIERQARDARARALWLAARRAHRALRRWLRRQERAWQQDAAREQLRGLSDRMLRDIGLHRSQIDGLYRRA
jgi:uncharacterized protein YjiS (DUF1127 family)